MVRNRAEPIIGPGPATEGPVDVRLLKEQVAELQAHNSLFLAKIEQLERDNQKNGNSGFECYFAPRGSVS
jgi:hypothetical protein